MNIHLIPLAGYCFFQPFRPFELHGGGKIDLVILFFLVRIRNDFFVFRMTAVVFLFLVNEKFRLLGAFVSEQYGCGYSGRRAPQVSLPRSGGGGELREHVPYRLPYRKVTSNDRATKGTCLRRMPLKNRKKASE